MNELFMEEALIEAEKALCENEIPVGAVIVKDGKIIARGHNMTEQTHDPTAHAEIVAIREAGRVLGESLGWRRLSDCDMYVTIEPCSMCAGSLVWSRIETVYIGVADSKAGGCGSVLDITGEEKLNHKVNVVFLPDGELKDRCSEIVKAFFRDLRDKEKIVGKKKSKDFTSINISEE